jgi:hypothetical protein
MRRGAGSEISKRREVPSMAKKRIGILAGGGDVPGLNSVLKTVTYRGSDDDVEIIAPCTRTS